MIINRFNSILVGLVIAIQAMGTSFCLAETYPVIFIHGFSSDVSIEDQWQTLFSEHSAQFSDYAVYSNNNGKIYSGDPIFPYSKNTIFFFNYYRNQAVLSFGHQAGKMGLIPAQYQDPAMSEYNDGNLVFYSSRLNFVIQSVLNATQATKVNIVAFGMGGLVARAYIMLEPQSNKVNRLLMIGTPNNGLDPRYLNQLTSI